MSTIRDYYNTGDDELFGIIDATNWKGQTFTATSNYDATSVKLKMYKNAGYDPGTVTVSIRNTTTSGMYKKPTGLDLAVGTIVGNDLTEDTGGRWEEIVFDNPYYLISGVEYVICVRCAGTNPQVIYLREDSEAGYLDGNECHSSDSGSSWSTDVDDALFEIWGVDSDYTIEEYYTDVDSYRANIWSTVWEMQSFTPSEDFDLIKVDLKLARAGGPVGNAVISIRNTDDDGKPTGLDLAISSIDCSLLGTDTGCTWVTFDISSLALTSGLKYAIILRPDAPAGELVWALRVDGSYAGGQRGRSTDSGVTWDVASYTGTDFAFKTYRSSAEAPTITIQPISQTKEIGDSVTFSITAEGYPIPIYQWYKGVTPLTGETSTTLTFTVDANSGGDYTCVASNGVEPDATSDAATLSIIPEITDQSSDTVIIMGQLGTLAVTAVGYPTLTYQWKKDGKVMIGETSSGLLLWGTLSNIASYTCVVKNGVGEVTTASIVVTVINNPYTWNPFNLTLDAERAE